VWGGGVLGKTGDLRHKKRKSNDPEEERAIRSHRPLTHYSRRRRGSGQEKKIWSGKNATIGQARGRAVFLKKALPLEGNRGENKKKQGGS